MLISFQCSSLLPPPAPRQHPPPPQNLKKRKNERKERREREREKKGEIIEKDVMRGGGKGEHIIFCVAVQVIMISS